MVAKELELWFYLDRFGRLRRLFMYPCWTAAIEIMSHCRSVTFCEAMAVDVLGTVRTLFPGWSWDDGVVGSEGFALYFLGNKTLTYGVREQQSHGNFSK